MKQLRVLLLYANSREDATLSYRYGWPRKFQRHPRFSCIPVNVLDRRVMARVRGVAQARLGRFDAILMLHSIFSNGCCLAGWLYDAVAAACQPKAYFIANEYKLLPEKMRFCEDLGVGLFVSQTDSSAVHALYRARLGCRVMGLPSTGLDTSIFFPSRPYAEREIDLGYRAANPPMYIGHDERRHIARYFLEHGPRYGLRVDVSLRPEDRLAEPEWADFLNRCKGQLGTESGGDFFELTDATRLKVNEYMNANPNASWEEIYKKFFEGSRNPVPIRIISGRNIEAAGTKTVQLLFEGHYSGYLDPDVHYIPLKKDLSNADEAIEKFRDRTYAERIAENAYQVAVNELTYERLIDRFYDAFAPLV
jgi:hypothetical protein